MAQYLKGYKVGHTGGHETMFYGASEAPRVHGITSDIFDSHPRFKNQYFVSFTYSELAQKSWNEALPGITHRVKSIDAPRFDIETETMNQYNKPRILPTKINYNPITITFWDDRSNKVNNFWRQVYNFYFYNGIRVGEAEYAISDSNIVTDPVQGNSGREPGYEKYGYYTGNKFQTMNLFSYMSLYMVSNLSCHRIDLINPYLQSMQHDQFSQEMSAELAQNTVTWGYENVVYYGRNSIKKEDALMGVIGGDPSNIFQWDNASEGEYESAESTHPRHPHDVDSVGRRVDSIPLPGKSPLTDAQSMATGPLESNEIDFYETYGPGLGGYKPKSTLGNRFPGANILEAYKELASSNEAHKDLFDDFPAIETFFEKKTREEQLRALAVINAGEFNFSAKDFKDPTGVDKIKALGNASDPAAGVNNRPAIAKPWINPNTGKPATPSDPVGIRSTVAYIAQQLGLPQTNNPAPYPPDDPPTGR